MTVRTGPYKPATAPQDAKRSERLAKALRANLSRRKAKKAALSEREAGRKEQG